MIAARASIPDTGLLRLCSTTSEMTSRLRERWEPFWLEGRSTNTSIVQIKVTFLSPRLTCTGFLTPVTPTRVSMNPPVMRLPWTSLSSMLSPPLHFRMFYK